MIDIKSLPENQKAISTLNALSADLQKKGTVSALHAAARTTIQALRTNAPDDPKTGGSRLALAINKKQAGKNTVIQSGVGKRTIIATGSTVGLVLGPNKKVQGGYWGWLGWILQVGADAHDIRRKRVRKGSAPAKAWLIGGKFYRNPVIKHPGTRVGKNWMSKSLEQTQGNIERDFYQGLKKWIDRKVADGR